MDFTDRAREFALGSQNSLNPESDLESHDHDQNKNHWQGEKSATERSTQLRVCEMDLPVANRSQSLTLENSSKSLKEFQCKTNISAKSLSAEASWPDRHDQHRPSVHEKRNLVKPTAKPWWRKREKPKEPFIRSDLSDDKRAGHRDEAKSDWNFPPFLSEIKSQHSGRIALRDQLSSDYLRTPQKNKSPGIGLIQLGSLGRFPSNDDRSVSFGGEEGAKPMKSLSYYSEKTLPHFSKEGITSTASRNEHDKRPVWSHYDSTFHSMGPFLPPSAQSQEYLMTPIPNGKLVNNQPILETKEESPRNIALAPSGSLDYPDRLGPSLADDEGQVKI